MPRIFVSLAIGNGLVLVGTAVLGWLRVWPTPERHVLLAVFSLLVSCLVQVLLVTYFSITGKLVAQAVHLGGLDVKPLMALNRRKRAVMRRLGFVLASVVLVTSVGAAHWSYGTWASVHSVAALVVLCVHMVVLFQQYFLVAENAADVERTMSAYTLQRNASVQRISDEPLTQTQ